MDLFYKEIEREPIYKVIHVYDIPPSPWLILAGDVSLK